MLFFQRASTWVARILESFAFKNYEMIYDGILFLFDVSLVLTVQLEA